MQRDVAPLQAPTPPLSLLLLLLLFVATGAVLTALVPPGAPDVRGAAMVALITEGWPALLWLLSAIGLGLGASRVFVTDARDRRAIGVPLGIALLLIVDQVAGSAGLLAGPIGAWSLLVPGWIALMVTIVQRRARDGERATCIVWPLAPAVAVLVVAALSSPGFLWSTEFGGYDALSYHLALPRDWLEVGRLTPLKWNAYSYLPSWIEGATLHLFALGGDVALLGLRAQLLHALLALASCACVASACVRVSFATGTATSAADGRSSTGRAVALLAAALFIGTPWIVVTGSMAYNEMGATLACAALVLTWFTKMPARRRGVLLGAFVAMAVGSKLSAAVIVLPPVAVLLLMTLSRSRMTDAPRAVGIVFALAIITASVALSPWLVRNAAATGNPLFPFAASIFGGGPWTSEQLDVWRAAHGATGDAATRLTALWQQLYSFGIGTNPIAGEPWRPFWGVLPWIGVFGAIVLALPRQTRRLGIALLASLVTATLAWLLFTHMKSRFFIPVAPIAAIAGALAIVALIRRWSVPPSLRAVPAIIVVALACAASLQPVAAYWSERPDAALMIAAERSMSGDALAEHLAKRPASAPAVRTLRSRAFVLNFEVGPLAERGGERVLLIGDAATFRYRAPIRWSTVWTRDPLVRAVADAGSDAPRIRTLLRDEEIGWVLIDATMLGIWSRSGWLDPALTPETISRLTSSLEPLGRLDDGSLLLRVPARAPDPPPLLR